MRILRFGSLQGEDHLVGCDGGLDKSFFGWVAEKLCPGNFRSQRSVKSTQDIEGSVPAKSHVAAMPRTGATARQTGVPNYFQNSPFAENL